MSKATQVTLSIAFLLVGGCVPPEKPPSGRAVRVAVLQGANTLTLSSRSTLTIKDGASGKVLHTSRRASSVTVASSSGGISVAGKTQSSRSLNVKSTSDKISLNGKTYPGSFQILRRGGGLLAVNIVDLDTYLKAVVPSEMLPTWPHEALKAQAVICRSFVLFNALRNGSKDYDITSTTLVYNPDKRDPRTDRAVDATKHVVLFCRGELLLSYFCTSCGGFTEYAVNVWGGEGEFPSPVECPFCREASDYRWRATIPLPDFQRKLRSAEIASASSIAVHKRSTSGGRITALRVQSGDGEKVLGINRFRMTMGPDIIRSGFFDMEVKQGSISFRGRGWGHGVGMCQRGAKVLAERGDSFESILKYYFPGARTRRLKW